MDFLEREIYENAINLIGNPEYGFIISRMCESKRDSIYKKMIGHYEKREEYEKCEILKESVLNPKQNK